MELLIELLIIALGGIIGCPIFLIFVGRLFIAFIKAMVGDDSTRSRRSVPRKSHRHRRVKEVMKEREALRALEESSDKVTFRADLPNDRRNDFEIP